MCDKKTSAIVRAKGTTFWLKPDLITVLTAALTTLRTMRNPPFTMRLRRMGQHPVEFVRRLLVVAFSQIRGSGFEVAEEAAGAFVGACGKVELGTGSASGIVAAGCGVVGRADIPEAVDSDGVSVGILQQAFELSGDEVIYSDGSAALGGAATGELADEEIVTDSAEVLRSESYSPGSVEPVAMLEALDKTTFGGEDVDIAKPWAVGFERLTLLVENIGDDNVVTDGLDVERNVVAGQETIGEDFIVVVVVIAVGVVLILIVRVESYAVKVAVVDIDATFGEVGCVEVAVPVDEGASEAGVAGSIGRLDHDDGIDGGSSGAGRDPDVRVPPGDCAVESSEEKAGGKTAREDEVRWDAVEDCSGGGAGGEGFVVGIDLGGGDDQGVFSAGSIEEGAEAGAVIGDPPGAGGAAGQTPGVDEGRVGDRSDAGGVGDEIDLSVVLS